jgi:hypothetical protein
MKIELTNGSIYRVVGANNIDSFRGLNAVGVVLSEYAFMNPEAWQVLRPILDENGGWSWFVTTPNGRNHAYKLFQYAMKNPQWFAELLNIDDTGILSRDVIEEAVLEGMAREDAEREYLCTFDESTAGSYYGDYIKNLLKEGRINDQVTHNRNKLVYTSWDLGVDDETVIWFWQEYGRNQYALIDCYSNRNFGLEHYISIINSKNYTYGAHFAPHDIAVREFGTGTSRIEQAANLGLNFEVTPKLSIEDGIQASRLILPSCHFNSVKCELGIQGLQGYCKEYDEELRIYKPRPKHDWCSNFADSFKTGAIMINQMKAARTEQLSEYAVTEYNPFNY